MPSRLQALVALLALSVAFSGCLSGGDGGSDRRAGLHSSHGTTGQEGWGGTGGQDGQPGGNGTPTGGSASGQEANGTADPGQAGNGTEDPEDPQGEEGQDPSEQSPEPTPLPGPVEPMQRPNYTVGSWWHYSTFAPGFASTLERELVGFQEHDGVVSFRWESHKVIPATGATITDDSIGWQGTQDNAWLEVLSTKKTDTEWGDFTSHTKVTYDPHCPELQWPLQVGNEWQNSCSYTKSEDGRTSHGTTSSNYTVLSFDRVVVPAGVFGAFRVQIETGNAVRLEFWSPDACGGLVRSQNEQGTALTVLEEYGCD
jgi:hypothetical protein